MKPLLSIKTIPIAVERKVTRAALRQNTKQPTVNITRQRGGLDIRSTPPKINADNYEMRASMGIKSAPRVIKEQADQGKQDAMEATRNYAEDGNQMLDYKGKGSPIPDMAMSRSIKTYETVLTFMPSQKPEMWVEGGEMSMNYTMDRLNFDWDVQTRPQLEYVPPSVEFNVTQYPEVIIEYLGEPIYVPPSANPNYDGPKIDVNA